MKRILTFCICSLFLLSLAGCGNSAETVSASGPSSAPLSSVPSEAATSSQEPTAKPESSVPSEESTLSQPEAVGGKALIAYLSCTGNTKSVAETLHEALPESDLFEITPAEPYTDADLDYNTDCRANREQDDASARPAIANTVKNLADYDVIYVGYPIWWGVPPRIIQTFLESYDFSGKTIVPFCTSGGSGYNDNSMAEAAPGAALVTGSKFSSGVSVSEMEQWVAGLGLH